MLSEVADMRNISKNGISSAGLHVLAMAFMLCDHAWAMLFPAWEWLTCLGRLAFPIFAFMVSEGYAHTSDLKKYMGRMLLWAVISEAPFDLMYGGSFLYPFHQNVLWTFLLALSVLYIMDWCRKKFRPFFALPLAALAAAAGYGLAYLLMLDYYGPGVLTVVVFHIFRRRDAAGFIGQIVGLYIINVIMLGGYYYEVSLFGRVFELVQQSFAVPALIPIWLYNGKRGYNAKWFRLLCYGFYPGHILLLYFVRRLMGL